jgi:chromosomal replication initiator protein
VGDSFVVVWDSVLSGLKTQLPPTSFETWFSDALPIDYSNGALVIGVPDSFKKGGIERRYRDTIEGIATSVCQEPVSLEVRVLASRLGKEEQPLDRAEASSHTAEGGSLPLNSDYSFAAFVRGENNRLAVAASEATADAVAR